LGDETITYIQDRLQERLELKNDKLYDAADEIRDELNQRFGVTIDDRMQEWNVEVDQFTVVNNDRRTSNLPERRQSASPPSYLLEEDDASEDDDSDDDFNDSFEAVFDSESDITAPTSKATTDETNLESLTIPELKERLRALGLPLSGKKAELIERLSQSST
jgi:SAP domain